MLFDTIVVLFAVIIIARSLFAKHGKITTSLLAIGLSALLTASLTPYYLTFIKVPNQGLATVVYYVVTYLLFYVLIAVPAILLSSCIRILVVMLLLAVVIYLLPSQVSSPIINNSRVYPVLIPLLRLLPPVDFKALGRWFQNILPGQ